MDINMTIRRAFWAILVVLVTTLLVSCGFQACLRQPDICSLAGTKTINELTDSDKGTNSPVFDDGTIFVYHGFGCAESNKKQGVIQDVIRVEQSHDLPPYASNATVFLNGWNLKYLNGDHHVAGLGNLVSNIRLEGRTLKWNAVGIISDKNFDDPYNWCYRYTVVAWNTSKIDLTVDQNDGCNDKDQGEANFFNADNVGTTTALSSFFGFLQNPSFNLGKPVAILPRGFGYKWKGCDVDHHILQLGYNLDHSEIFIEGGKQYKKKNQDITPLPIPSPPASQTSRVDSGFVSWDTYTIFKDSDSRRDYDFGEMVSGLVGKDVGVIQPPFSILPDEESGRFETCIDTLPRGIQTQEFVVENVPYEYALPMLTGWESSYGCNGDQHVAEVGASIDEFHYDKNPGSSVGTLRYKLSFTLHDKNNSPGFDFSHKVTVLGLKSVPSVTSKQVPS
jgi:hypothetical protein